MVKISDEHKKEMEFGNYFKQGVHKVQIMAIVFGETEGGKPYAEITVTDDSGEKEGSARVWFTTDKAIAYSFSVLKGIFTHNTPEDKREKVKAGLNKITDTETLEEECQKLIGKECWYTVYENPDRTYTGQDGKTRNSYDRNIYGYEPEPRNTAILDDDAPAPTDDDAPIAAGF